jgi:hypothetical protein
MTHRLGLRELARLNNRSALIACDGRSGKSSRNAKLHAAAKRAVTKHLI